MRPSAFLQQLWGDRPDGLIQLWRLDDRRSRYLRSPAAGDYYADGQVDVYTGVGLAGRDHGRARRARAEEVVAIAGLWLDVDVDGGPGGKRGGAPHVGAAAALASSVLTPTLLIRSGHGLHAWWLFESPWRFASREQQAAAALASLRWQARHRELAAAQGFGLDATHDLARLLRPPGTLNGKGAAAAPVVVVGRGPRHGRTQLVERALAGGRAAGTVAVLPPHAMRASGMAGGAPSVEHAPAPPFERLAALIARDARFAATWRHQRREGDAWSLSEYDLSLAAQLAAHGFDDQAIADTIRFHRRRWRAEDRKGDRPDYLRRTIAKARAVAGRRAPSGGGGGAGGGAGRGGGGGR